MKSEHINPIVALAGATAKIGNSMFAADLLACDSGEKFVSEVIAGKPCYVGYHPVTLAKVMDDKIQRRDFPSVSVC